MPVEPRRSPPRPANPALESRGPRPPGRPPVRPRLPQQPRRIAATRALREQLDHFQWVLTPAREPSHFTTALRVASLEHGFSHTHHPLVRSGPPVRADSIHMTKAITGNASPENIHHYIIGSIKSILQPYCSFPPRIRRLFCLIMLLIKYCIKRHSI